MEMHERLKWAREQAGFESAAEAARALGLPEPTYSGHENGTRGFGRQAARYASRFRVSLSWLLTGQGVPQADLQDRFNALPAEGQEKLLDYLDMLENRAERAR